MGLHSSCFKSVDVSDSVYNLHKSTPSQSSSNRVEDHLHSAGGRDVGAKKEKGRKKQKGKRMEKNKSQGEKEDQTCPCYCSNWNVFSFLGETMKVPFFF